MESKKPKKSLLNNLAALKLTGLDRKGAQFQSLRDARDFCSVDRGGPGVFSLTPRGEELVKDHPLVVAVQNLEAEGFVLDRRFNGGRVGTSVRLLPVSRSSKVACKTVDLNGRVTDGQN
jgi:hypothetical protein